MALVFFVFAFASHLERIVIFSSFIFFFPPSTTLPLTMFDRVFCFLLVYMCIDIITIFWLTSNVMRSFRFNLWNLRLWLSLFSRIIRIISLFMRCWQRPGFQANFLISCIDFDCDTVQIAKHAILDFQLQCGQLQLLWYFMEIWFQRLLAGWNTWMLAFDVKLMLRIACALSGHRCQPNEGN